MVPYDIRGNQLRHISSTSFITMRYVLAV